MPDHPAIASSSKTLASGALDSGRTSTPGTGCQVAGGFVSVFVGHFRAEGTHSSRNEVAKPTLFFLLKNPVGDGGEGSGRTSVTEAGFQISGEFISVCCFLLTTFFLLILGFGFRFWKALRRCTASSPAIASFRQVLQQFQASRSLHCKLLDLLKLLSVSNLLKLFNLVKL